MSLGTTPFEFLRQSSSAGVFGFYAERWEGGRSWNVELSNNGMPDYALYHIH